MSHRKRINELLADYRALQSQVRTETAAFFEAEELEANALLAQKIIQIVAQKVQQEAHEKIAGVVSRCLEAVFDNPYQFEIQFEQKRGRTEANLVFKRGDLVVTNPTFSVGGGVLDVAAFALRIACLVLEKPLKRRLLVLDEPFSGIRGEANRHRMRNLVETLATDFDLQFVLCIDHEAYPEFLLGHIIDMG